MKAVRRICKSKMMHASFLKSLGKENRVDKVRRQKHSQMCLNIRHIFKSITLPDLRLSSYGQGRQRCSPYTERRTPKQLL